jgi:hypothetical protein
MKDLLVGSVFVNESKEQHGWFDLQMKYLKATTSTFDHVSVVSQGPTTGLFQDTTVIRSANNAERRPGEQSYEHARGLNALLAHFKQHREGYKSFLFIDSDAFPIRRNWLAILNNRMSDEHEIAVALRTESRELRLHSSILYARTEALDHLDFTVGIHPVKNLANRLCRDVHCGPYQDARRDCVFVLLKSNKVNLSPTFCSVYYDLFYHHGGGSRKNISTSDQYWGHLGQQYAHKKDWVDDLMQKPSDFISLLAGWNPEEYPKVGEKHELRVSIL